MTLVFNELSFLPLVANDNLLTDRFIRLIETYRDANRLGFNGIIFPSNYGEMQVTQTKTFFQWINNIPHQGHKNQILSHVKRPFTDDVLEGRIEVLNRYYFEYPEAGIPQTYCTGLATAYDTERPSTSLSGLPVWENIKIPFQRIINEDFETEPVEVYNIAIPGHLENDEIIQFAENTRPVNLLKSDLQPDQKLIHFREDHGTDILMAFARRITISPYIDRVINSLPFNPNTTRFLRNIAANGQIEIVLHWEDEGYGMVIQTTGRNLRETHAIAEIIRNEYDR